MQIERAPPSSVEFSYPAKFSEKVSTALILSHLLLLSHESVADNLTQCLDPLSLACTPSNWTRYTYIIPALEYKPWKMPKTHLKKFYQEQEEVHQTLSAGKTNQ